MSPRVASRSYVRKLSTSRDDVVVPQLFALPSAAPRCQDDYLSVAHRFRISQTKDSSLLEPRGKDLAAFTDMLRRNHKDEYASGFQPAVRVRQEHSVRSFRLSPIVQS
jgi:predicted ATPase